MNALRREGGGTPVHLSPEDFEVYQTSSINQCSTVIMLDMSYSMLYGGRFQAGRKVALALDSLIRTKFPRDELKVVAFSYFVLPLEPHMLLDTYWIDPRGTDFPEAIRTARNILEDITVNTFMLDAEPTMTEFVKALTKINRGRIFFADPRKLGEYLIVDYVKNRRRVA
jgi:uncharacterized protein with von Willebrand factor type A (vWA) domain